MKLIINIPEDTVKVLRKGLNLNNAQLSVSLQTFLLEAVETFRVNNFGICTCGAVFRKNSYNQRRCKKCIIGNRHCGSDVKPE